MGDKMTQACDDKLITTHYLRYVQILHRQRIASPPTCAIALNNHWKVQPNIVLELPYMVHRWTAFPMHRCTVGYH